MFHLLRRQVKRNFRKPLVVLTPKSMLRTNTSTIDELVTGRFHEMIDDPACESGQVPRAGVKRVILCSGKFYYELADRRDKLGRKDTALVRVEQFYPLHRDLLVKTLAKYPKAELIWAQEEPRNAGGYLYMDDVIRNGLGMPKLEYIGRDASASPAVGSKHGHKVQQEQLVTKAIGPAPEGKAEHAPAKVSAKA